MNNVKFYFEEGLNYRIFHMTSPTKRIEPITVPFPCLIYCTNGSAKFSYNTTIYTLKQGMIFCTYPNVSFKPIEVSEDFLATTIIFDSNALIDSTIGFNVESLEAIFANPNKSFEDPHHKKIFNNLFDILDSYHQIENQFHRNSDFVYGIIRCTLITLAELSVNENQALSTNFSTTDSYFREFLKLLSIHCKTQHNVAFYADKLCITPKYLNEICRKKAKLTAKEVITRSVIAQIKNALMISGTSVQRIAYDFNFCDQSSFGKYFKKAVGVSPMAFRNKHNAQPDSTEE